MAAEVVQRKSGYYWWKCPCGQYGTHAFPTKVDAQASAVYHDAQNHPVKEVA